MMIAQPAVLRPVPADCPMSLWQERHGWRVVSGFVDLFAVPVRDGVAEGRRSFLVRINAGQILLPLALSAGCGILAVGGPDAALSPVDGVPAALAVDDVESWVQMLCAVLGEGASAAHQSLLEGAHDLAPGDAVSGRGRLPLWADVVVGRVRVGDGDGVVDAGDPPVPLTSALRLTADLPTRLAVHRTRDLQESGRLEPALAGFHEFAAAALAAAAARRQDALAARVADRARQSRRMMEQGYAELARVVEPERVADTVAVTGDPALAVVRRVAATLDLEAVSASASVVRPGPHGRVGEILRASGLRARVVLLRDAWWRRDGTALIGRRQGSNAPLALLPRPGGYAVWDSETASESPVTAELAEQINPQALAVYPRFTTAALRPGQIAALGLRGSGGDVLRLLLLALGTALLALLTPLASALLVDEIIPAAARGQLGILVAGMVVAALTTACFELTKALTLLRLEGRLDFAIQSALFDRLLRLPAPFFKRYSAGDLADRVLGMQAIRQMLTGATVTSLLGGVFATVSLGMLFAYSVPLAALAVVLALVSAAVTAVLVWLQLRREREVARLRGAVEAVVLQLITGIGKIAVAAAGERALAHWAGRYAQQKRQAVAAQVFARAQAVFMAAFPPLTTMIIFLAMAMLTKSTLEQAEIKALVGAQGGEAMGTGSFLAFNAALGQFLAAMTASVRALSEVLGAIPLWERAKPVLAEPPEEGGERHSPGILNGGIEFSDVGFSYIPGGAPVLNGITATIRAGEYVALVGPSGSGKSTIMRLLLGLEQAGGGDILLDGKPLSRLDLTQVRAQMGVVLQNARILPGDVFQNIVGDAECRLEDAWEAAAMVGLDDDIRALPMGMHTVLMEGGATLSGGQRQRLAIARALVRKPRILLLDEATSALDNRTQAVVTESLARLPITRILIAHRLSTITAVDTILVIDQGRVVQRGSYAELMAVPGLFADMAKRQIV